MATMDLELKKDHQLRALGYGIVDANEESSPYLKEVDLTLYSTVDCVCPNNYLLQTNVGPDGQDTCAGDSGQSVGSW